MKTIKQIAEEIGVSRQAIERRLSKEPLRTNLMPYIKIINWTKYIDITGENLIKSVYDNTIIKPKATGITDPQAINANEATGATETQNDNFYNEIFKLLREDINILKEQLKVKDNQLEIKDNQLKVKDNQLEIKDNQISDLTGIIKIQAESITAAQQTARAEQLLHADTKGLLSSETDMRESAAPEKKKGLIWGRKNKKEK